MWGPKMRKSGGGTGFWGKKEEEEAEAILTIFNHRGSTGEDQSRSILKLPPAFGPQYRARVVCYGEILGGECPGQGAGCQVAEFGSILMF